MTLALDISQSWVPNIVTDAEALALMRAARKAGARRVVAGTQIPSVCNQQLVAADLAGMTIEAYLQIKWDRPFGPQLDEALWAIGGEPIRRLWLAVEPNFGDPDYRYLAEAVKTAKLVLPSSKLGTYSNYNSWVNLMGDPQAFGDMPYWWAQYDAKNVITAPDWRKYGYGPWFKPTMKQYIPNAAFAGMNVDLNVY